MSHPGGDKVVIAKQPDGHYVYFNVHDPRDTGGTIIDFIQHRQGLNLGQVRQLLRPWIGVAGPSPRPRPDPRHFVETLEPVSRDLVSVRARFEGMRRVEPDNHYMTVQRGIPSWLLAHPKLADSVRVDDRGNVCFAHTSSDDPRDVCGYEVKNNGFTGFASGGMKGLWSTKPDTGDNCLSVAESAIDAISYAAMRGIQGTRLVSIAGQMNAQQPALLRLAMLALPAGGRVVSAMDHDAGGDALAAKVQAVFAEIGRADLTLVMDPAPTPGSDWNDELRRLGGSDAAPSPG